MSKATEDAGRFGSDLSEGLGPTPPLAARLRSACSGDDEWRVQDPKDGSYCIAFNWREVMNPERMAREWLADHCRRFPGGLHTDFVVACVRVHTEADKLMLEAAVEIERLAELADSEGTRAVEYLRRARAAEADANKSERRAITFGDIVHSQVVVMQAAVLEGHLKTPAHGLQWIVNTLTGPGHLPDLEEARALGGAQAYWDRETAKHEEFRREHPGPAALGPNV